MIHLEGSSQKNVKLSLARPLCQQTQLEGQISILSLMFGEYRILKRVLVLARTSFNIYAHWLFCTACANGSWLLYHLGWSGDQEKLVAALSLVQQQYSYL